MALKGGKKVKKKSLNKKTVKKNHKKNKKHLNKGKKYSIKKKRKMKGGMYRPRRDINPNYNPHSLADEQYKEQVEAEKRARENPRRKSTGKNNPYYTRGWNKKTENFDPNKYTRVSVDNTPGPRPPGSMQIHSDDDPTYGGQFYQHADYGNMNAGQDLYAVLGTIKDHQQGEWGLLPLPDQYEYEKTARLINKLSQNNGT
mgnify:CR=1 FL=1